MTDKQKKNLPIFFRSRFTAKTAFDIQREGDEDEQYQVGELAKEDEIVFKTPDKFYDEETSHFKSLNSIEKWQKIDRKKI
ncbi:hypothetical protein KJ966_26805 [bacterium]|nr:hypothetical protein [bacterium]